MIPSDSHAPSRPPTVPPDAVWKGLVASARAAGRLGESDSEVAAPYGFTTRVVAQWREIREQEKRLAVWQRLSWRAALASLALSGLVAVSQQSTWSGDDRPLLEPPAFEIP
ncbi:MAG: hypothetical protein ACKV19_27990 [Verrucomicrobiales bacterium]